MAGATWYSDGQVTVTRGSALVVGVGCYWLTQVKQGDAFAVMDGGGIGKLYEVAQVIDNTHLELRYPYDEVTAVGVLYAVARNFSGTWSMTEQIAADLAGHIREFRILLERQMKGDKGDPGENGNTILSGTGVPSVSLGVDQDWYINMVEDLGFYRKEGGAWILRASLKGKKGDPGDNGTLWYVNTGDPLPSEGSLNDLALNADSGAFYKRTAAGWAYCGTLKGGKGDKGDKGDSIKGDKGDPGVGAKWHTVTGVPSTSLGVDLDMAVDTSSANGTWYQKVSGVWSVKGSIRGPQGIQGPVGGFGVNWKGNWDVATAYVARDGVYYNGSSFVAAQDNTGQVPPDPLTGGNENWTVVARKGLDGTGSGDMLKADYDSDGDGKVNAAVIADQATYAVSAGRATVADKADATDWNDVENKPDEYPAGPHGLSSHTGATLAELNTLISDADIPSDAVATQTDKGLMSAEDKSKLDALGSGGSSVMLTLVHTTIPSGTTATAYEVLATGQIVGRSDWYGPKLTSLVRRSGSGQVRLSLSDGTTTITAETAVFAVAGTDKLTLDTSMLIDGVAWNLTVEALATIGTVTVDRLKIMADPVNEFAPPLVGSGTGNSTNSTSWAELGTSTFLPTWLDVDGRGGVILLVDVDLGTATGAEIRITIGTESVTQAITSNGVAEIHCPFPSTPSAIMSAKIEGRVTDGMGTINLSHWQLHIEK